MKLPKICEDKFISGFTFIEILLVVAIVTAIFAFMLPVSWNFYLDFQFDSEYNLLISLLRNARNLSMVNYNESSHGLYIGSDSFIVFQGQNYASRLVGQDKVFPRNSAVPVTGPDEVLFVSLSGQTSSSTYSLTSGRHTGEIFINPEGLIYE